MLTNAFSSADRELMELVLQHPSAAELDESRQAAAGRRKAKGKGAEGKDGGVGVEAEGGEMTHHIRFALEAATKGRKGKSKSRKKSKQQKRMGPSMRIRELPIQGSREFGTKVRPPCAQ